MKKEIYKLFTAENGVRMSGETLDAISSRVKSREELEDFFSAFKAKYNSTEITCANVLQISEHRCDAKPFYKVHTFSYKPRSFPEKYEYFKRFINRHHSPISMLQESGCIYGILYKNRSCEFVLEDDHDTIILDFSSFSQDAFLFENMFVCLEGTLKDGRFVVTNLILPDIKPYNQANSFLKKEPVRFGLFGKVDDYGKLSNVIKEYKIELALVSSSVVNNTLKDVVSCQQYSSDTHLPIRASDIFTSNPFVLELFDKKISFIDYEICQYKQKGWFFNKNCLRSFLKTLISQRSANPFDRTDFHFEDVPNFMVLSQSFQPFIMDIDGVCVVSLPPLKEDVFCIIDLSGSTVEMIDLSKIKSLIRSDDDLCED